MAWAEDEVTFSDHGDQRRQTLASNGDCLEPGSGHLLAEVPGVERVVDVDGIPRKPRHSAATGRAVSLLVRNDGAILTVEPTPPIALIVADTTHLEPVDD